MEANWDCEGVPQRKIWTLLGVINASEAPAALGVHVMLVIPFPSFSHALFRQPNPVDDTQQGSLPNAHVELHPHLKTPLFFEHGNAGFPIKWILASFKSYKGC